MLSAPLIFRSNKGKKTREEFAKPFTCDSDAKQKKMP